MWFWVVHEVHWEYFEVPLDTVKSQLAKVSDPCYQRGPPQMLQEVAHLLKFYSTETNLDG